MLSVRTSAFAVAATLFLSSSVKAQDTIDPSTVPYDIRVGWCNSQQSACPLLCLQLPNVTSTTTEANDCDPNTLDFDCVCSNGQSPNATEYSQTIPYFICTEWDSNCVAACNGDTLCQSACRQNHPCGAQNPPDSNTSTATGASTVVVYATATGGGVTTTSPVVYNGLGGATTSSNSAPTGSSNPSSASQVVLSMGKGYGLGVTLLGIFAGFTLFM